MLFEDNINESLKRYPTLFANREHVIMFMFTVIGNGYDWKNGELVDYCKETDKEFFSRRDKEDKLKDIEYKKHCKEFGGKYLSTNELRKKRVEDQKHRPISLHSLYNLSLICCLPENITDDYLTGAKECVKLIKIYCNDKKIQLKDSEMYIMTKKAQKQQVATTVKAGLSWLPKIEKRIKKLEK